MMAIYDRTVSIPSALEKGIDAQLLNVRMHFNQNMANYLINS